MRAWGLALLVLFLWVSEVQAWDYYWQYQVKWGPMAVGKIELWIGEGEAIAYAYTTGLGAWLLPLKARWQLQTTPERVPLKSVIEVLERKKARLKLFYFEPSQGRIRWEKKDGKKKKRGEIKATFPVYDEFSAFLKTLSLLVPTRSAFSLPVLAHQKIYQAEIQILRKEILHTFRGKEKTWVVKARLPFPSELIRRSREVTLWVSQDRIPVLVQGKIVLGHLTAVLTQILVGADIPPPPAGLLHSEWRAPG